MNRRGFLRTLAGATAAIVVAPASALDDLDALTRSGRTYFDMGRNARPEPACWYQYKIIGVALYAQRRGGLMLDAGAAAPEGVAP